MTDPQHASRLRSLSGVVRWTIIGTLSCMLVSLSFNLALFGAGNSDILYRILMSATVLPALLAAPSIFYCGLKLRHLALDNIRLGRVARIDSLTACLNRGAFATRIESWLRDATPAKRGALLMIDADNFKSINDRYGHQAGDEALTIIARAIRSVLRNGDIVGRMGGEEFAVFLPNATESQAAMVAERIRNAVNHADFEPDGARRPLSVSIGGAAFSGPASFPELFRIADQRLYGVKHAGRNAATVVHVEDHPMIRLRRSG